MFNFIFTLIVALVSYLIYAYPIGVFHLLFATDIQLLLLYPVFCGVVFIYFRTHNSSQTILRGLPIMGWALAFLGSVSLCKLLCSYLQRADLKLAFCR